MIPEAWQPIAPVAWVLGVGGAALLAALLAALVVARDRDGRVRGLVLAGMVVLVALAALGPALGDTSVAARRPAEVQVLVVLDRTVSMSALDGREDGSRLETAVADLTTLPDELPTARLGLVTFGSSARLVMPFTTDHEAFRRALSLVGREKPTEGRGSRIDRPLETVRTVLGRSRAQHPDRDTVVVLVSDGENTAPGRQSSFGPLAPLVAGGLVVGHGTAAGAPMPIVEGSTARFLPDLVRGGTARSVRDEANLRRIADELGVAYVDANDAAAVDRAFGRLAPPPRAVPAEARTSQQVTWLVGLVLAGLAAVLLRSSWQGFFEALRLGRRR